MKVLVYIDVSRKQEYIYRSNSLRDNLFHSGIIKAVTEDLRQDRNCKLCQSADVTTNMQEVSFSDSYNQSSEQVIRKLALSLNGYLEQHYKDCYGFEFSGGGNSIVHFSDKKNAERFIREYTRAVLEHYPELELYISLVESNDKEEMNLRKLLIAESDRLKDKRRLAFKRWTYGLEQIDEAGRGLAVISLDKEQLTEVRSMLSDRLSRGLSKENETEGKIVEKTIELQKYEKREQGKSYIGVIAIDGNRMGEMVNQLTSFKELREFSNIIDSLYLEAVITALWAYGLKKKKNAQNNQTDQTPLYYTPIVLAGDDVCLITEGEYAIQLAAQIVKNIQTLSMHDKYRDRLEQLRLFEPLTACVGVSIVKIKYPFFEAVRAAEELCHSAKQAMHKVQLLKPLEKKSDEASSETNSETVTDTSTEASGETIAAKPSANNVQYAASFINWSIVEGKVREQQAYDHWLEYKNMKQNYHIKPLRIDQQEAYRHGIVSYDAFRQVTMKVKDLLDQSSFIHKLKQAQYSGWDAYQLLFETNKMDISDEINLIVHNVFKESGVKIEHAALIVEKNEKKEYIYVLNDVLEAIDFMVEEDLSDAAFAISDEGGAT